MSAEAKNKKGHRRFARSYDEACRPFEKKYGPRYRGGLVQDLHGTVLEIGVGTGANFPFYQAAHLNELVGIEPDFFMLEQAQIKREKLSLPIKLMQASAEELPFADATFDAVVATLVCCSIPNPAKALAEIRRVLKPSGKFYFFEHVAGRSRVRRFFQNVANPLWQMAAAGCQINRDTANLIEHSGFKFETIEWVNAMPTFLINPQIWGVASKDF